MTLLRLTPPTRLAALGALALCGALLAGCTPAPEPAPTPTPAFASEEEAFAAAEETYRAYNDALNADRSGSAPVKPQSYLVGSALEGFLEGREYLRTHGLALSGSSTVTGFNWEDSNLNAESAEVVATVCLDVTNTRVLDANGADVTPATRPDRVAQHITLLLSGGDFVISEETEGSLEACS